MKEITTSKQFNNIIKSYEGSIIKFYTTWCPDCSRMDAFIGEIIEKYEDTVLYSLNKDHLPEIAETYDVMGIPSLLVFKNGDKIGHLHSANAKTPEQVEEFLLAYK